MPTSGGNAVPAISRFRNDLSYKSHRYWAPVTPPRGIGEDISATGHAITHGANKNTPQNSQ
jgi:hypothetical protein